MKAPAVAMVLSILAAACGRARPAPPEKSPPSELRTIDVVRVAERPLDVTLSMTGELNPYQMVAIYPRVTGFIKTIRVDRGSRVRRGEVLATLEAPELVAERAEAQSRVQGAQAQLAAARSKADASAGTYEKLKAASLTPGAVAGNDLSVAEKSLEADQNQAVAAQQNVEAARHAMNAVAEMESYLRVIAPFDGVVTERNVHPGALVGPSGAPSGGLPMVRIVENARLRLVVALPEAYLAKVTTGTVIPFTVSAFPGETFTATVARVAQSVDIKTRTMAVELDVQNKNGRLTPGVFCQVRWPLRRTGPSILVPAASVASTTDRSFVIRIRNGRTEWVDVKTGIATGTLIEVFGDLRADDQIAARGTDELRPGTDVRVKELKPPAS